MLNLKEIILLDDNEDTNFYNKDIIEDTDLFENILVYTKPNSVLDLIESRIENNEFLPGVFLVDIKMPEMDGFEFLDELDDIIGELDVLPKVFILSTSSHIRDKEQYSRSYLAKAYLNKPLEIDDLKSVLRSN